MNDLHPISIFASLGGLESACSRARSAVCSVDLGEYSAGRVA